MPVACNNVAICVQLVEYAPEKRMTAAQALAHPLISASRVGKTLLRAKTLGSAATEAAVSLTEPWLSTAASGAKLDAGVALLAGEVSFALWVLRDAHMVHVTRDS